MLISYWMHYMLSSKKRDFNEKLCNKVVFFSCSSVTEASSKIGLEELVEYKQRKIYCILFQLLNFLETDTGYFIVIFYMLFTLCSVFVFNQLHFFVFFSFCYSPVLFWSLFKSVFGWRVNLKQSQNYHYVIYCKQLLTDQMAPSSGKEEVILHPLTQLLDKMRFKVKWVCTTSLDSVQCINLPFKCPCSILLYANASPQCRPDFSV